MIDWLAVKKAAEAPIEIPQEYKDLYNSPITEEQAKLIANYLNGGIGYLPLSQVFNPSLRITDRVSDDNGLDKGITVNGNKLTWNDDKAQMQYDNGNAFKNYFYVAPTGERYDTFKDLEKAGHEDGDTYLSFRDRDGKTFFEIPEDNYYFGMGANNTRKFREFAGDIAEEDDLNALDVLDGPGDKENAWNSIMSRIDPNGYLAKYGFKYDKKLGSPFQRIHDLNQIRSIIPFFNYLRDTNPDGYKELLSNLGYDPFAPKPIPDSAFAQLKAARRWGNSMINLTPQQYAYYDAKRNYNANPGDTRYNLMMQAKQPLKPADLQNIKKYTVQQRMMNTPQPNGLPKTPQMLQREWQDENKRRQTVARDMYKNEVQGLKNRTGVNAVPTMTQPWGGR